MGPENIHDRSYGDRKIVYADEFKRVIRENPGALKKFLGAFRDLLPGETYKTDGLQITTQPERSPDRKYFKVDVGNEHFFVKYEDVASAERLAAGESPHYLYHGGHKEFAASMKIGEILKDVPWVEVIGSQLGYEDADKKFYVSEWRDLPGLEEYLEVHPERRKEMKQKRLELWRRLSNFSDFGSHNMFYDEKNDKIVIFDMVE